MKSLKQKILAAKIEYHWWRIARLKKKQENKASQRLKYCENLHRYYAEKNSEIYEVSLGLRDRSGKWIY